MKYYVVLDTNVIVSALHPQNNQTAITEILEIIFNKNICLLYNDKTLSEYKEVLSRKELGIDKNKVGLFINYIKKFGMVINSKTINEIFEDEDDKKFYEIVMSTRNKSSYLVTGNLKHFPKKNFIVNPKKFMEIYNN